MSRRKKTGTGYLNAILLLLLMMVLYKIGGITLLMILFTVGIGFGAIYLSGESLGGIFGRRINVTSLDDLMKMNPYQFERFIGDYFRDCGYVFLFDIPYMTLHLMLIKFKSCFKTAFKLLNLHVCLYFFFKNKGKLCKRCHIIL